MTFLFFWDISRKYKELNQHFVAPRPAPSGFVPLFYYSFPGLQLCWSSGCAWALQLQREEKLMLAGGRAGVSLQGRLLLPERGLQLEGLQ